MAESRLILSGDLSEFFKHEVSEARDTLQIELSEVAEYYLVNLLCDFSRRENSVELGEEPLALLYKRALEASPAERQQIFKNLGDLSLYVAGFFSEFIERSLVDVGYYISMGGSAYGSLSDLMGAQKNGAVLGELYYELAQHFTELVDLLNQVSDRSREKNDCNSDLLRLYERWLRTGSQRVQRLLAERGLLVWEKLPTDRLQ